MSGEAGEKAKKFLGSLTQPNQKKYYLNKLQPMREKFVEEWSEEFDKIKPSEKDPASAANLVKTVLSDPDKKNQFADSFVKGAPKDLSKAMGQSFLEYAVMHVLDKMFSWADNPKGYETAEEKRKRSEEYSESYDKLKKELDKLKAKKKKLESENDGSDSFLDKIEQMNDSIESTENRISDLNVDFKKGPDGPDKDELGKRRDRDDDISESRKKRDEKTREDRSQAKEDARNQEREKSQREKEQAQKEKDAERERIQKEKEESKAEAERAKKEIADAKEEEKASKEREKAKKRREKLEDNQKASQLVVRKLKLSDRKVKESVEDVRKQIKDLEGSPGNEVKIKSLRDKLEGLEIKKEESAWKLQKAKDKLSGITDELEGMSKKSSFYVVANIDYFNSLFDQLVANILSDDVLSKSVDSLSDTISGTSKEASDLIHEWFPTANKYFFDNPEKREVTQFARSHALSNLGEDTKTPPTVVQLHKKPEAKGLSTLYRYEVKSKR